MKNFNYRGYIVKYEIKDGKVFTSHVDYCGKQLNSEHVFDSTDEMKKFIDAGGWGLT